jgi:hypothetical protein
MREVVLISLLIVGVPANALSKMQESNSQWGKRTYIGVDPAGSKGSQSLTLSISSLVSSKKPEEQVDSAPRGKDDPMVRLHVSKGFPLPLDVGLILGSISDGQAQQAGGHVQWTIYEGFRMPALSLRGTLMRTYLRSANDEKSESNLLPSSVEGLQSLKSLSAGDTRTLEFAGSWGLFGILTPYAGAGWITMDGTGSFNRMVGLEIQLAPPFARASIEARQAFSSSVVAAKISLGL